MASPKSKKPVVVKTATVKIHSPVSGFSGESAGVQFRDGVGETDNPWLIQWFEEHGYKVVGQLAEKAEADKTADESAPGEEAEEEKGDE